MCFAADKFKHLFDALKLPNRGAANEHRCDKEVSYNKMLLISRLFYFMRLTRNVNFKDSDESLKGVSNEPMQTSCRILNPLSMDFRE